MPSTPLARRGVDVTLPDGTPITIRPLDRSDMEALVDFHEHLSPRTVYLRYFAPHPHLAPEEAEHFCALDGRDRYALVAYAGFALVGVARMERLDEPAAAEVAFLVADAFQHRGLGRILVRLLFEAASERGVTTAVAETLGDNHPMIHLLTDCGHPVEVHREDGLVRITCRLDQPYETNTERKGVPDARADHRSAVP